MSYRAQNAIAVIAIVSIFVINLLPF